MRWKALIFALMIVTFLSACTIQAQPMTETTPTPIPTAPPDETDTEPIVVNVGESTFLRDDESSIQLLNKRVELFESAHPGVKINIIPWGWDAEEFPKQLATGEVPDVMEIAVTEGPLVIDGGYAADITELMEEWPITQDFNELILSPYVRNGRFYGVPNIVYIMGLFYDKTLFTEAGVVDQTGEAVPPTNWDEFVSAARAIKENTPAAGFCILTQHNQGGWNFMNWGWQAGGIFEEQVGGKWQATFDQKPIVEAMEFMKALRWEHDVLQEDLVLDAGGLMEKLAKHECGMALIAPDWFQNITGEYGGKLEDFGLTKLPTGPAGDANLMGGAFFIINSEVSPEVKEAAFEWITWRGFSKEILEDDLITQEGRNRWAYVNRGLMYKPNSPTIIQEKELVDKYRAIPYFKDYVEAAGKHAHIEPPIAVQELYATLDEVLWEVLNDENADTQALLTEAAAQFQKEYLDLE